LSFKPCCFNLCFSRSPSVPLAPETCFLFINSSRQCPWSSEKKGYYFNYNSLEICTFLYIYIYIYIYFEVFLGVLSRITRTYILSMELSLM
jgi:hypothetical protein